MTELDKWIKNNVPKTEQVNVDAMLKTITDEYNQFPASERPNLESILSDLGSPQYSTGQNKGGIQFEGFGRRSIPSKLTFWITNQ